MTKFAQYGQEYALYELGIPPGTVGLSPGQYIPPEKEDSTWSTIRKIGPALGATIGGTTGFILGRRAGIPVSGMLGGLGTGATLGWMPDVFSTAGETLLR